MGALAFLASARLVAGSSSIIDARSIVAKDHLTMVQINPIIAKVESTTLDIKFTIV
jgi:hypothetical protein